MCYNERKNEKRSESMKTAVYIVSGFLGAGKTTLIQKLLKEYFIDKKVALIENDFGEVSIDASLFKSGGFEVREMNSGCICCSLSGDFIKAMHEIVKEIAPEVIVIEPSGVGKLSDVIKACTDGQVADILELRTSVTVVDVKRCRKYAENFGEFFEDQIQFADKIVLSRVEEYAEKIDDTMEIIRGINTKTVVYSEPISKLDVQELMTGKKAMQGILSEHPHRHDEHCGCHEQHVHDEHCGCHEHHVHDEHCGCNGSHAAEDVFDTITFLPKRKYASAAELRADMERLDDTVYGEVLRGKGIVETEEGLMNVQYLPGEIQITPCSEGERALCIIGKGLEEQKIKDNFQ